MLLRQARIATASLNISAPFVGAAAEAKREEKTAENSTHKTLRMVGHIEAESVRTTVKAAVSIKTSDGSG